ncbi:centrosomal protein of 76 kDa-like [Clavelina lepadiformis]|uniref:centrosomal protein of 76 kDa-like n=1 Tax=Clavelina lepadiformis TaxID=159417 RepID=UPI004041F101
MEISSATIQRLRELIHKQVAEIGIQDVIEDTIANFPMKDQCSPDMVMDSLKQRGIIENIHGNVLNQSSAINKSSVKTYDSIKTPISPFKSVSREPIPGCLVLCIHGGKAFLEHLNSTEPESSKNSSFTLHIHFRGQRCRSKPVPVSCEPNIFEEFLLNLNGHETEACLTEANILSMCDPIHLILTKTDPDDTCSLISSHGLEWRHALASENYVMSKSIEMMGVGTECTIPAGILNVKLQFVTSRNISHFTKKIIDAQLQLEQQRMAERDRLFLIYAKQWWKEYLQLREEHKFRQVKIFAQDECGTNRPVFCYVQPIDVGRLIPSPLAAARFVSVLAFENPSNIGTGCKADQWQTLHAFLCSLKGQQEDHSNLLCSILLGFGLDAYVCVGTKGTSINYTWVATRYCDGKTVFFWDPLTGHRYAHHKIDADDSPVMKKIRTDHPFHNIGCLYNHEHFYANLQHLDTVETTDFSVENSSLWKAMNLDAIKAVSGSLHPSICSPPPPLLPPSLDTCALASDMEAKMRALVTVHRKSLSLSTVWDHKLGSLLGPSLASYEVERSCGLPNIGNIDFQDAIRRYVPEGNTFKGFPVQYLHCNAQHAFETSLKNGVCSDIVECRGDDIKLAVRVHITTFPDDAVATWIMFACRYCSVL